MEIIITTSSPQSTADTPLVFRPDNDGDLVTDTSPCNTPPPPTAAWAQKLEHSPLAFRSTGDLATLCRYNVGW